MIETDETIEGAAENPAPVDKTVMADVLKERAQFLAIDPEQYRRLGQAFRHREMIML